MAKILALVSFKIFPPHMGGQKHVALFYEHLVRHHEVVMLVSSDNTEKIEAPYPVRPMLYPNRKMLSNYSLVSSIAGIIKEEKIDCIIAEHSYTGWLAYMLRKKTGKPFIIHSHNLEVYRFRQMKKKGWRMYKPYERWIHQKADHNFFISEADRKTAIKEFNLRKDHCSVSPYGAERPGIVPGAKEKIKELFGINNRYIFHFNGTMDYEPNIDAVNYLVDEIDPRLSGTGMDYRIVISGKRLPENIQEKIRERATMSFLDFIDDINLMYQATDVFLNPVTNNSGIKTKLVEALANNCTVVSTSSGASGIPENCYEGKMFISPDHNWDEFCRQVLANIDNRNPTPSVFFDYFSWENIALNASMVITELIQKNGSLN